MNLKTKSHHRSTPILYIEQLQFLTLVIKGFISMSLAIFIEVL